MVHGSQDIQCTGSFIRSLEQSFYKGSVALQGRRSFCFVLFSPEPIFYWNASSSHPLGVPAAPGMHTQQAYQSLFQRQPFRVGDSAWVLSP